MYKLCTVWEGKHFVKNRFPARHFITEPYLHCKHFIQLVKRKIAITQSHSIHYFTKTLQWRFHDEGQINRWILRIWDPPPPPQPWLSHIKIGNFMFARTLKLLFHNKMPQNTELPGAEPVGPPGIFSARPEPPPLTQFLDPPFVITWAFGKCWPVFGTRYMRIKQLVNYLYVRWAEQGLKVHYIVKIKALTLTP